MVVAPEFFAGNVELGVISQASSAFGHILDDLSIVVNSFADVSKFSAGIDRLHSFMSAIMALDPERRSMGSLLSVVPVVEISGGISSKNSCGYDTIQLQSAHTIIQVKQFDPWVMTAPSFDEATLSRPSTILFIKGLRLATPDNKRILINNLNLSLETGSHLLIVGASGSGKSSLLRAIAGLWNTGSGEIVRPSSEYVYFLPQRPYCPPGSLRDQLLYPSTDRKDDQFSSTRTDGNDHRPDGGPSPADQRRLWKDWTDDDLLKLLERVDLPHLAGRAGDGDPYRGLNTVLDWSNTLSLGEQQRLAFGRLVINRPRLVIMDESTSALDVVAERKMYHLLKDTSIGGETRVGELTYVSVGHRPSLLSYHNLKLSLKDSAGYVSEIPPNVDMVDEGFFLS
jgi:putative ATP-binding cassette transporter